MEQEKPNQKINLENITDPFKIAILFRVIAYLAIIGFLGYFGWQIYRSMLYQPAATPIEKVELKESKELNKIKSSTQYSTPISGTEPSGRPDPLAPY